MRLVAIFTTVAACAGVAGGLEAGMLSAWQKSVHSTSRTPASAVILEGESVASKGLANALARQLKDMPTTVAASLPSFLEPRFVFDCGVADVDSAFMACVNSGLELWTRVAFPGDDDDHEYLYPSREFTLCSVRVQECYGADVPNAFLDAALSTEHPPEQGGLLLLHHVEDVAAALASLVEKAGDVANGAEFEVPACRVTLSDLARAAAGTSTTSAPSKTGEWTVTDWSPRRAVLADVAPSGDYALAFTARQTDEQEATSPRATAPAAKKIESPVNIAAEDDVGGLADVLEEISLDDVASLDDDVADEDLLAAVVPEPATTSLDVAEPADDEPAAAAEAYESRTVAELKDLLRARKLKLSGRKKDLVARLRDDDAASSQAAA